MARYEIQFTASAARSFRKLDQATQQRVARRIDALTTDPRPDGVVKLEGAENIYRARVGAYRILYSIEDKRLIVLVVAVGHRRDIYR